MAWVQISFEVGVADFKGAQKREYQKKSVIKYLFCLSMTSRLIILLAIVVLIILTPEGFGEIFSEISADRFINFLDFLMVCSAGLGWVAFILYRTDRTICVWSYFLLWNTMIFFLIAIDTEYGLVGGFRLLQILHIQIHVPETIGRTFEMINGIQFFASILMSLALVVRAIEYKHLLLKRTKGDIPI